MTEYLIRAIGFANDAPCPHAGKWLARFDHDAFDGQGVGSFTSRLRDAKRFADAGEAMAFWNKQSSVRPLRADGEPNKPLTALTIEIERAPSDD